MPVEVGGTAAEQEQQEGEGGLHCASPTDSDSNSSSSRMRLVAGGIALALLLLILIPAIIPLMLAWCVVEVLFYMLKSRPEAASLDAIPQPHWPEAAAKHDLSAFNRFLRYSREAGSKLDYKKYLSGWFLGADVDSIRRENIEEFVAYGFCYKSREQLAAEGKPDLVKQMTDQLEHIWDIESPPGYNPDIKFMAHLWEPLDPSYRPLAFYLLIELVAYCSKRYLTFKGFEAHRHSGINYYTLHLESQTRKPAGQQAGRSTPGTAPAAAAGAAATAAAPSRDSMTAAPAGDSQAADRFNSGGSPFGESGPTSTAAAASTASVPTTAGSLQQQLHTIQEQHPQQEDLCSASSQGQLTANGSCSTAVLQEQLSGRDTVSTSQLSDADLALLESPFAMTASGQFSADLAGAGLIPESEALYQQTAAAAAAANGAAQPPAAGRAGSGNGTSISATWKKAKSVPASAAAAADGGDVGGDGQQQQQQQLKQRASCSVLQQRLAMRPSVTPGYKMKPLQAALSQALTEAGILEAGVPVVFLHGIGGLPAYLELLQYLEAEGSPLLAVEVKSVAMRLGPVYPVAEVAAAVLGMMDKLGVRKACFVAHSYGTFVASYIAKQHPQRMRGCVLIDPVCLGMFMPNLIYNFLYKRPVWQGWSKPHLAAYVKAAVRSFVSREVHVRASVARRFYWSELNLWPEDLPAGSTVLLSGKDDLMDSPEVEAMLKGASHLKVKTNEELTHGAFLLNKEVKQAIQLELQALLASSGSAVFGLARQLSVLVHPAAAAGAALTNKASIVLRRVHSLHHGGSSGGDGGSGGGAADRPSGGGGLEQDGVPVGRSRSEGSGLRGMQGKSSGSARSGDGESDTAALAADQRE